MKVLQIVSIMSPDGAYGGPMTVALNQVRALADMGHDVTLAAGHLGFRHMPHLPEGASMRLFRSYSFLPRLGFAAATSPGLLAWAARSMSSYEVLHVHLARDLTSLPIAAMALTERVPLVIQTHGMIDASNRLLARPLDALLTKPVLRWSRAVCYLNSREKKSLCEVTENISHMVELPNGVPPVRQRASFEAEQFGMEVLFVARLEKRKRPLAFAEMARILSNRFPGVRFAMIGPDEGQGREIKAFIQQHPEIPLGWEGPIPPDKVTARLARSTVYVHTAVDEPFGMTVLEAMSVGVPVVITNSCGLANVVRSADAGEVVGDSVESLADGVARLLSNARRREVVARNASRAAHAQFGIDAVARKLEKVYEGARGER